MGPLLPRLLDVSGTRPQSPLIGFGRIHQPINQLVRIETDDPRELQELDYIDAALLSFDVRDEGLMATHRFSDLGLVKPGLHAPLGQEFRQALVSGRTEG